MGLANTVSARAVRAAFSVPWERVVFVLLAAAPVVGLVLAGCERRWMDDDGFINLRVVRNWLQGHGPVFNIDERVEAGTSPLWLLVLAGLGGLGMRLERAAVGAGIFLTAIGLAAAQAGARRLHDEPSPPTAFGPRLGLPVGAAIFAALPPAWDYASGGLETGLGLAWLGASFWALSHQARRPARASATACCLVAMLVGIGPLVRPEFALYSLVFLLVLASVAIGSRSRGALPLLAGVALCAGALPVLHEIVRMGYFGAVVPNTALAKEAFMGNWNQGRCYFQNFFGTYLMGWPLVAAAPFWLVRLRAEWRDRRRIALALMVAPTVAAAVHVLFLVGIGGDYMHGRLLLSPVFAALLPVMMVPASIPVRLFGRVVLGACGVALASWVVVCSAKLRVDIENVCNVGDERGWYARKAEVEHPVDLDAFRKHPFFDGGLKWLQRVYADCPTWPVAPGATRGSGCRRVFLDDETPHIAPAPATSDLASDMDPAVQAAVPSGAIGLLGYLLRAEVHVVDVHGLADPVAARFELESRGRPGHEKRLSPAWQLARFSEPAAGEDAAITAARHALRCGALSSLIPALTAPMTFRVFFDNVVGAWSRSRLRIPSDPFDAETRFCQTPPMRARTAGGEGGTAFRWRCPAGRTVYGIRGAFEAKNAALSFVQALCRGDNVASMGPLFGATSDSTFEVACPADSVAVGLYGSSDHLVRSVGLICSKEGASRETSRAGAQTGQGFALTCPDTDKIIGLAGRSGELVDALGVLCESGRDVARDVARAEER